MEQALNARSSEKRSFFPLWLVAQKTKKIEKKSSVLFYTKSSLLPRCHLEEKERQLCCSFLAGCLSVCWYEKSIAPKNEKRRARFFFFGIRNQTKHDEPPTPNQDHHHHHPQKMERNADRNGKKEDNTPCLSGPIGAPTFPFRDFKKHQPPPLSSVEKNK